MDVADLGFRVDSGQVDKASRSLDNLSQSARKTETATERMNRETQNSVKMMRALGGVIAAIGIARVVRETIQYSDAWKQVNNQLRQVTRNEQELQSVRKNLLGISRETNTALDSTVGLYSTIVRSTKEMALSSGDVAGVVKTVNQLFMASGASAQEAANAIRQMSQGLAAGALRGEEFNSVSENAPRIMDAIAEKLKMTRGELRAFAAEGGITSKILVESLQEYSDEAQRMADQTDRTFGQHMVNAGTNMMVFVSGLTGVNTEVARAGSGIEKLSLILAENANNVEAQAAAMQALLAVSAVFAARIGGPVVQSLAASTAAKISNTTATMAQARATALASAAEIDFLRVNQGSLSAQLAQSAGTAREAVLRNQLRANTIALTAANGVYNASLATLNVTARVTTAIMGGLRAVMAFLGGPVGVVLTAASAIWIFRDSLLGLIDPAAGAKKEVDKMLESMGKLNQDEFGDKLVKAISEMDKELNNLAITYDTLSQSQDTLAQRNAQRANEQFILLATERDLYQNILEIHKMGKREAMDYAGAAAVVGEESGVAADKIKETIESLKKQIIELTKGERALFAFENANDATALALYDQVKALEADKEATEAAKKAKEQYRKELQSLTDRIYPQAAAVRKLMEEYLLLNQAIINGDFSQKAVHDWLDLNVAIHDTPRLLKDVEKETTAFGKIWDTTIERLQGGIADMFYDMLERGKVTFDNILDLFKRMVAEMAAQKFVMSIGLGGASGTAMAGGTGGAGGLLSGASNLSSLLSLGKLGSGVASAGNFISGGLGKIGLSGTAWGLESAGYGIAEAFGFSSGVSSGMATSIGTLASAVAGYAGSWVGTKVGEALFGKEAESAWGATVGSIAGTIIGGPIGALLGGAIGGAADALFGGDGKKRAALGIVAAPGDYGGASITAASGLQLSAYTKRAGEQGKETAEQMLAAFAMIDASLTGMVNAMGVEFSLAGESLTGKAHQAGKTGGSFFGSAEFNRLLAEDVTGAADAFVMAWLDEVRAQTGAALDLDPIFDLATEGEALGDTLIRVQSEFGAVNAVLGAMGRDLYDTSVAGMAAASAVVAARGGLESFITTANQLVGIAQVADQLRYGELSGKSQSERFAAQQAEFARLQVAVEAGDMDALARIGGAAAEYAASIRKQYATSATGNAMYQEVIDYLDSLTEIPAFASGGVYRGGLALVGEQGPELINFGASGYVHPAGDTRSMLDTSELVAEMRALRQENQQLAREVAYMNRRQAEYEQRALRNLDRTAAATEKTAKSSKTPIDTTFTR